MKPTVVVLDYGLGNVRSIVNALNKVGANVLLSNDEAVIMQADACVLPGVGSFPHGMQKLQEHDLVGVLHAFKDTDKPLLGICLGMQLLMSEGEEFGKTDGLGFIQGRVVKLNVELSHEKLPHVGWSEIVRPDACDWEDTIFHSTNSKEVMYFVHSFVAEPLDSDNVLSKTQYSGSEFCSSVKQGNVYGCQFHPEKSAGPGLNILENFTQLAQRNN